MYEHLKLAIEAFKSNFTTENCKIVRNNFQEVCADLIINEEIYFFIYYIKPEFYHQHNVEFRFGLRYYVDDEIKLDINFLENYEITIFEMDYKNIDINELPTKNLLDITEEDLFYIKLISS